MQAATLQKEVERKMRKVVDKSKDQEYEYLLVSLFLWGFYVKLPFGF